MKSWTCDFCGGEAYNNYFGPDRTNRFSCNADKCRIERELEQQTFKRQEKEALSRLNLCPFEEAWVGYCMNRLIARDKYCQKHLGQRCWKCGKQAVRNCSITSQLVCGVPCCAHHPHEPEHNISSFDPLDAFIKDSPDLDETVLHGNAELSIILKKRQE